MASFELVFEEDEDVLEATFAAFDESFSRTLSLSENIVLHTDLGLRQAWGITFYSYLQMLQVGETELEGLQPLAEVDRARCFALLSAPPVSAFFEAFDPENLRVRLRAPGLRDLLNG